MPSRRRVLRAGAGAGAASVGGCLGDVLESKRLQGVNFVLWNSTTEPRPFHVMLELESGESGWRTTTVAGETRTHIELDPGPDATPTRFHAVAGEYAEIGGIVGVDNADGEFCVTLHVHLNRDALDLSQRVSYGCDVDL